MFSFITIRCFLLCAVGIAASAVTLLAADPRYIPPAKNAPSKAEMERKSAEMKRKFEQTQRDMKANHQQALANMANARNSASARSSAPAFDPEGAPPPDECLQAFLVAAKSAGTMNQILPYLSQREQEILKSRQARFDPARAAKNRESLRKQNPKLTAEDLEHLSSSPYDFSFKWHKRVANSVIRIKGVKVDGDKATVTVSTNSGATINGERYDYGVGDFKMVGEGRTWKIAGFDNSIMVYKEAP